MADVTRCDICGSVVEHEEGFFIQLYSSDKYGKMDDTILSKDLCPTCKEKVMKILKLSKEDK